jgi:putative ABC transport system ATP-binding protein
MSTVVECENVSKRYGVGELSEWVLAGVSLTFRRGEMCVLLGPSGSGKTTLLSILGCMLSPTTGALHIAGHRVEFMRAATLSELRRRYIGFVFQHAQLLPFLTVEENLRIVGRNAGLSDAAVTERIERLLTRLSVDQLRRKSPAQLSGGQRQRVAIARALLHKPLVLLADEPTAALDWHAGAGVAELLVEQAKAEQAVLVVVTHDTRLVRQFDRVLRIDGGRVWEEA